VTIVYGSPLSTSLSVGLKANFALVIDVLLLGGTVSGMLQLKSMGNMTEIKGILCAFEALGAVNVEGEEVL